VDKIEMKLGDGPAFDIRNGQAVARGKASFRLGRGEAALVTQLPYDVQELELTAPEEVAPGRRVPLNVVLKTRGGLPGEHLVRIEFGPVPGAPLRHYGRNLVCKDGKGNGYIALSRHERPGLYRLFAWDVLSGLSAEAMVRVEEPSAPEHKK
jgi:hypothetical protein